MSGIYAGRWFSPGTLVSSTNKTDRHDITEILLKVTLNTIIPILVKSKKKLKDAKRLIKSCKSKDRQYNGQQKKGQTIQWSTEKGRTDNTMVNRKKDRQYNGQKKKEGQTIQWSKEKRRTDNTMVYKALHRKLKIKQHEPY